MPGTAAITLTAQHNRGTHPLSAGAAALRTNPLPLRDCVLPEHWHCSREVRVGCQITVGGASLLTPEYCKELIYSCTLHQRDQVLGWPQKNEPFSSAKVPISSKTKTSQQPGSVETVQLVFYPISYSQAHESPALHICPPDPGRMISQFYVPLILT